MVHNPLDSSSSCPILQYADDTLILLRGELGEVTQLKMLLDQFSAATGLRINYHKSTAVPMHMKAEDIPDSIALLGCLQEGFPQTYLGLPLSCEKLRLLVFDPYINKADRYLAGWQASLLNPMGRTVLINAVLDGQLSYVMSALPLSPGVVCQWTNGGVAFSGLVREKPQEPTAWLHGTKCAAARIRAGSASRISRCITSVCS